MSIDSSFSGGQASREDIGDNRDSTASSASGSTKSAESSTTAATTPDRSITSLNGDKLTRTVSRSRSLVLNTTVVPELPPPVPSLRPPKSILSPSISSPNLPNRARAYSLSRAPSVQFAPLPQLAARKRKSSVPLGISARSSMMQKRRRPPVYVSASASFDDPDYDNNLGLTEDERKRKKKDYVTDSGGMWTEEEAQEHLSRQLRIREKERAKKLKRQQKELEKEAARSAFRDKHGYDPPDEPEDDDPFNAFGKLMKEAWSKLGKSSKGKTKIDPHTRTQSEAETLQSAPHSPVAESITSKENESPPNEFQRSAHIEAETEEEEEQDDGIDPHEVDMSKVVPLRSGSPPPLHFSGEDSLITSSETSSITNSDSDSARTCPTSPITTSPSSITPPTNEFPSASLLPTSALRRQ